MPLNKDVGNWIKDFMKSNAPQFKGKLKEERKDMALAAYREKYGSLEEAIDVNDPALAAFRAQMATREKKAAEPKKFINPNYAAVKNASKIDALKKKRAQIMIDMEQEAEPEGGPIADRYGAMLNKIDAAIDKLQGRKEMPYDQAIYMSKDEIERRAASLEEEEEGATAAEEDKFHRDLDKLVHKTFGHSSDEKKEMKEEVDQKQADIYAYQFMQYFNKMRRVVAHNFGDDTRKEFEKLVQYKFSEHNINEEAKPDFLDIDKDRNTTEPMKKAAKDKAVKKAMEKVSEVIKVKSPEEAAKVNKLDPDAEVVVDPKALTEGHNYDYEGKMAHSQLLSIVKNSRDLFNMIGEDDQLKAWVQSKLTKAEDYLDAVKTYLDGEELNNSIHEDKK